MVWKKISKIIIFFGLFLFSLALILKYILYAPYIYIAAEVFIILLFLAMKKGMPIIYRVLALNLAAAVLVLGAFETYFVYKDRFYKKDVEYEKRLDFIFKPANKLHRADRVRGFAPNENVTIESIKIFDGKLVYDVVYTTNRYGLRVAPHDLKPNMQNKDFKNALFFGCSFTFGEGVNDNETLPFIFEEESGGKYKAYNFGVNGYGPHQMLAILESGMIDDIITDKKQVVVFYQALNDHVERSSFNYPYITWDTNGPRYKLDKYGNIGKPVYIRTPLIINKIIRKSFLLRAVMPGVKKWKRRDSDRKLFVQIVKKSKEIVENKYKGKFYVIYWDTFGGYDAKILKDLQDEQIVVLKTSQILESSRGEEEKLYIKNDSHPSKLTYQLIAEYLLDNVTF